MPHSIISLFDEQQKSQLLDLAESIEVRTGEILFNKGDKADHTFMVKRGRVTLFRLMPNGDEKLFKVFLAGEMIAEMAIFMTPRTYPMSARADQDSELLAFTHHQVLELVTTSSELSVKVMGMMSNKICQLMNTVDILTQVSASQRLVMKFAEFYRHQTTHKNKVVLPMTKRLLATQLGMTPETLSRTIKKLKTDGLIAVSDNQIELLDINSLCRSVDLTPDMFLIHDDK